MMSSAVWRATAMRLPPSVAQPSPSSVTWSPVRPTCRRANSAMFTLLGPKSRHPGAGRDLVDLRAREDLVRRHILAVAVAVDKEKIVSDAAFAGIRACVFDAYGTLFDFASAAAGCRDVLGDKAEPLTTLWRDKQLQYTWLRAVQGRHADFWQVTGEALDF